MSKYLIGKVCKLLDVKPHVIRYWEKEFPFLAPKKNVTGRKIYTDREINILHRLKYLLHERRYTIEGARKKIWEEITSSKLNMKLKIDEIRNQLLTLLKQIKGK